jgi:hypothetical protein
MENFINKLLSTLKESNWEILIALFGAVTALLLTIYKTYIKKERFVKRDINVTITNSRGKSNKIIVDSDSINIIGDNNKVIQSSKSLEE